MTITRFRKWIVLISFFVCILFNFSSAQHFIQMTDEQWIQLALDMVRKGIQQQDTTKVFMVVAPEVSVRGEGIETQASLSRKLQIIFNSSYKRDNQLKKPYFPRADNPLHLSGFWDFDILDPKIKIVEDSAIVDCELVLWGAPPDKRNDLTGKRAKERLIFKVPPEVRQPLPPGEYHEWPASGKKQVTRIRSWQLVGFENLLDFLNGAIQQTEHSRDEDSYMKKK
jgi:hypothetical protein